MISEPPIDQQRPAWLVTTEVLDWHCLPLSLEVKGSRFIAAFVILTTQSFKYEATHPRRTSRSLTAVSKRLWLLNYIEMEQNANTFFVAVIASVTLLRTVSNQRVVHQFC